MRFIIIFVFLLPACYVVTACNGKRIYLKPQKHEKIVKYERQLAVFYLDAHLVQKWIEENDDDMQKFAIVTTASKGVITVTKSKEGDTLYIDELVHTRIDQIMVKHIRDMCRDNKTVDMAVYVKRENKFIKKMHGKEFVAKATHGSIGKRYSLFTTHHLGKWDYFFNVFYDFHGGF